MATQLVGLQTFYGSAKTGVKPRIVVRESGILSLS